MGPHLHDYWPFVPQWLPVNTYGFAIALGFLVGAWTARRHARRIGLSPDSVLDLALVAIVSGVAGARAFYVIQFYEQHFRGEPFWRMLAFHQGGLVFYGGVIVALPACALFIVRRKLPLGAALDVLAPALMLGLAFGRIGCFSFGCCYGTPTEGAYGVVFPENAPAYATGAESPPGGGCGHGCQHGMVFPPDAPPYTHQQLEPGTPLFPSQLASAAAVFGLSVVLSFHFKHWRKRNGETGALLLILYPATRFVLEMFRFDTHVPGSLSVAQWVSIFVGAGGVAWFALLQRRPPATVPPAPETAPREPSEGPGTRPTSRSKKRRAKRGKEEG